MTKHRPLLNPEQRCREASGPDGSPGQALWELAGRPMTFPDALTSGSEPLGPQAKDVP